MHLAQSLGSASTLLRRMIKVMPAALCEDWSLSSCLHRPSAMLSGGTALPMAVVHGFSCLGMDGWSWVVGVGDYVFTMSTTAYEQLRWLISIWRFGFVWEKGEIPLDLLRGEKAKIQFRHLHNF